MKIKVLIFLLIYLFSSCSKSDDSSSIPENGDEFKEIKKEIVIQSAGDISRSDNILTGTHPNSLYPMQVFEKKGVMEDGFFNEMKTEVSSYSLIFNFYPIPYIEEVPEPRGVLSYTKAFAAAMKSEAWEIFNKSEIKSKSLLLACGLYSSEEDAKAFLGEPSLYGLLDESFGKYIFLAKIISSKFDILTSIDGKLTDEKIDGACYVSSVTVGRYAYLAISTDENPDKIMDLFVNGILKGDMTYVDEYLKLSSVHIIEKGRNGSGGYWGENGYKTLVEIFKPSAIYTGVPILFELKDAATHSTIHPKS